MGTGKRGLFEMGGATGYPVALFFLDNGFELEQTLVTSMKQVSIFAVALVFGSVTAFGQATSAKGITSRYLPSQRSSQEQAPAQPTKPAAAAKPAAPASSAVSTNRPAPPREKTKEEKDEIVKKTVEFQKKRAEAGSSTSQYDLAIRYLNGDGVEKDQALARKWLEAAAKQDHSAAKKKLEELNASKK